MAFVSLSTPALARSSFLGAPSSSTTPTPAAPSAPITMQMSPFVRRAIAAKPWNVPVVAAAPRPPPFKGSPPLSYPGVYKPSMRKPPVDVPRLKDATFDVAKPAPSRTTHAADVYMAGCVTAQYKATATPFGEYTPHCSEGGVKGMADDIAVQKRSAAFRMRTRPTLEKYQAFFDARKAAIAAAHGCTYEEDLVSKFPLVARAFTLGQAEANRTCVRYNAAGLGPEVDYMARSVDSQIKQRACTTGVYEVTCAEGSAKGDAETKRVAALANQFRSGHVSDLAREQAKFDAAKYARVNFGHGCSYEEDIFTAYPAVAASMRTSPY